MDIDNSKESLNTLKEMILDERKLVTYISLSKEMCLHVNESKALLNQIVQHLRENKSLNIQLNVNYVISGLLDGNKAQTSVCNEMDLETLKSKFKIVFYQHLYSVSVGAPSSDNVLHMVTNRFEDFPLCTGLIKSNSCVKRSSDEIGSLKTNSQEVISDQKSNTSVQRIVKEEIKKGKNIVVDVKQVAKTQEIKSTPVIKSEKISPKKESTNNGIQKSDTRSAKPKGIAGFFNKPATNSNKKLNGNTETSSKNKSKELQPDDKTKIKTENMDVDDIVPEKKKVEKSNEKIPKNYKKENKSLVQIKKTAKIDKKRKRVLHVSDSESDEEKNDPFTEEPVAEEESEDEIPPTPLVNTVKITSGIMNPKKRRKIVDKTYTDEDGYILTKKEEVYESCSETEEDVHIKENIQQVNKVKVEVSPPGKKNGGKNVSKKKTSPQKGKQATLMSFFKKV